MISKHGQTGPTLSVHVHGVDRHDSGLRLCIIRYQDADPAVAEPDWVVRHPVEDMTIRYQSWEVMKGEVLRSSGLTWVLCARPGEPDMLD